MESRQKRARTPRDTESRKQQGNPQGRGLSGGQGCLKEVARGYLSKKTQASGRTQRKTQPCQPSHRNRSMQYTALYSARRAGHCPRRSPAGSFSYVGRWKTGLTDSSSNPCSKTTTGTRSDSYSTRRTLSSGFTELSLTPLYQTRLLQLATNKPENHPDTRAALAIHTHCRCRIAAFTGSRTWPFSGTRGI